MTSDDTSPGRAGRGRLSRDGIIDAALGLIDDGGLDALTMRNLGRTLGVDPMAVYGHFDDKAALVEAVVEHQVTRLRTVPGPLSEDPVEAVVQVWLHYREVLLEHPHLAPLVARRPLPQEVRSGSAPIGIHLLRLAGVADADIPLVANAVTRFALGFILQEGEARHHGRRDPGPDARRDTCEVGRRTTARWHDPTSSDRDFALGLRALLHGLGTHRALLPIEG